MYSATVASKRGYGAVTYFREKAKGKKRKERPIQKITSYHTWRHCPLSSNTADLLSR